LAIGARFTVFSKVGASALHSVMIARPPVSDRLGPVPMAAPVSLPRFLVEKVEPAFSGHSGTVVLMECLSDSFLDARALRRLLRQRIAFAFGRLSHRLTITVDGRPLKSGDPLTRTGPGFYVCGDNDAVTVTSAFRSASDRALPDARGVVPIRSLSNAPGRGIVAVRMGRRLGGVRDNPLWQATSDDRNWRIEIDYSPEFDADFRPNINLDATEISDTMWDRLEAEGLLKLVEALRAASN
jgi:hypothetical protein